MKALKVSWALTLLFITPLLVTGQELKSNLFLRTPQVVDYNITNNAVSYSPVMSVGAGFSHQSKFIELATFINQDDLYGWYSFFGTTLKANLLSSNLKLNTNWFGEITYIPNQNRNKHAFVYASGICFFLNHSFEWGSIGIPLCLGIAYSDETISLNARTIFNLSLNLD